MRTATRLSTTLEPHCTYRSPIESKTSSYRARAIRRRHVLRPCKMCRSVRFPDRCVPARDWSFCATGQSGSEINSVADLDNRIAGWNLFGLVRAVW
jgi:hypothetical protein